MSLYGNVAEVCRDVRASLYLPTYCTFSNRKQTNKTAQFTKDFLWLYPKKQTSKIIPEVPNKIPSIDLVGFHHTALMSGLYRCRE